MQNLVTNALSGLRALEREEVRYRADEARIAEEALEKLRTLERRFKK